MCVTCVRVVDLCPVCVFPLGDTSPGKCQTFSDLGFSCLCAGAPSSLVLDPPWTPTCGAPAGPARASDLSKAHHTNLCKNLSRRFISDRRRDFHTRRATRCANDHMPRVTQRVGPWPQAAATAEKRNTHGIRGNVGETRKKPALHSSHDLQHELVITQSICAAPCKIVRISKREGGSERQIAGTGSVLALGERL